MYIETLSATVEIRETSNEYIILESDRSTVIDAVIELEIMMEMEEIPYKNISSIK